MQNLKDGGGSGAAGRSRHILRDIKTDDLLWWNILLVQSALPRLYEETRRPLPSFGRSERSAAPVRSQSEKRRSPAVAKLPDPIVTVPMTSVPLRQARPMRRYKMPELKAASA
jgi:hypothetical protein